MSDEIERRLSDAFTAQAFGTVGDHAPVPPLQLNRPAARRRRRVVRVLAPLAAAAAVAALAIGITVHANAPSHHQAAGPVHSPSVAPVTQVTSTPAVEVSTVHLSLQMTDGEQVGVGMPVIAYLSKSITDGRALQHATTVTVNDKPVTADWYFAPMTGLAGKPMQAHLRMSDYWPAHAKIAVTIAAKGLSAGKGMVFDDDLSLAFSTGPAIIATVDDKTHEMTVMKDGTLFGRYPVSLGSAASPTSAGTKVVMEKGVNICMRGPDYNVCDVKYTQRLTYSGEYLHSAPWNVNHIKSGIDSSNGCTNLMPADAERLYGTMEIGDVVKYPDADGPMMTFSEGIDDWNVPWTTWLTGGVAPTH